MKYLLAHDLGTSGNKATLYSTDGALVKSITYSYSLKVSNGNWAEQDPLDWWRAVCEGTRALTEEINPDFTLSYHTKGEEIYWYFYQSIYACALDKALATAISRSTGYPLRYAKGSVGGYKDWCIQKRKIPSFTIEAGLDEYAHPIGEEGLRDIIKKNNRVLRDLVKEYRRLRCGN